MLIVAAEPDFAGEASRIRRRKPDVLDTRQSLQGTICIMIAEHVFLLRSTVTGRATVSFQKDTSLTAELHNTTDRCFECPESTFGSMGSSISTLITLAPLSTGRSFYPPCRKTTLKAHEKRLSSNWCYFSRTSNLTFSTLHMYHMNTLLQRSISTNIHQRICRTYR